MHHGAPGRKDACHVYACPGAPIHKIAHRLLVPQGACRCLKVRQADEVHAEVCVVLFEVGPCQKGASSLPALADQQPLGLVLYLMDIDHLECHFPFRPFLIRDAAPIVHAGCSAGRECRGEIKEDVHKDTRGYVQVVPVELFPVPEHLPRFAELCRVRAMGLPVYTQPHGLHPLGQVHVQVNIGALTNLVLVRQKEVEAAGHIRGNVGRAPAARGAVNQVVSFCLTRAAETAD